jgi:hypothetical protein
VSRLYKYTQQAYNLECRDNKGGESEIDNKGGDGVGRQSTESKAYNNNNKFNYYVFFSIQFFFLASIAPA